MTNTDYALEILNNTDYGRESNVTNGEIVTEWAEGHVVDYIVDYLDFTIGINGTGNLMQWEKDMAKTIGYDLERQRA